MKKLIFSGIAVISLSFLPGVADQQALAAGTQPVSEEEVSINNVGTKAFEQRVYSRDQGAKVFVTTTKSGTTYRGYLYKNYEDSAGSVHIYEGFLYRHDVPLPVT